MTASLHETRDQHLSVCMSVTRRYF